MPLPHRILIPSLLLSCATAFAACSSDDPAAESTAPSTATIGPDGGTLSSPEGVTITVPAGALSEDVNLTITAAPDAPVGAGAERVGPGFLLGPEGQTFAVPVEVTLPHAASADTNVVVMKAPAGAGPAASRGLHTERNGASFVHVSTMSFSTFVPSGVACELSCAGGGSGTPSPDLDSCSSCFMDCGGRNYQMSCSAGMCSCTIDGEGTASGPKGDCSESAEPTWASVCNFPNPSTGGGGEGGSGGGDACAPACTGDPDGCSCSAQCDGVLLGLMCTGTSCSCTEDGTETATFTGDCMGDAWTTECGFTSMGGGGTGGSGGDGGGSASCGRSCGGDGSGCACSADCGGVAYELACEGMSCSCTADGTETATFTGDCQGDEWTTVCGYPE